MTSADLTLADLLALAGLDLNQVALIRHSVGNEHSPKDLTREGLLFYTREQLKVGGGFLKNPPRYWVSFLADGGTRSRLSAVYENRGEVPHEADHMRAYDLAETDILGSLVDRLQVDWGPRTIKWAMWGVHASSMPVVEIADRSAVAFPGYDGFVLDHAQLVEVVSSPRYEAWRTALGAVQGIYLIADRSTGQLYVGKADGAERVLGRWRQYADNGHGGNIALRELAKADRDHAAQQFQFSLLRVFGPSTPTTEVDAAEAHFKRALLSREFGLNRN